MNITIREKNSGYQAIVSYKQNGTWKQKSKQGFITKKDAKTWANEMQFKLTEDRKDNIDTSDMTIKEALEIYLEYKKNIVKFSSFNIIKTRLEILQDIQYSIISNIKPIQITNLIQDKQKNGHYYNNEINTIKTFFNFCIKELKIIRENPVNYQKRKRKDTRTKYISYELYNEILEKAPVQHKLYIKILYNTGMRKSEIYGLKYQDIQDSIITVTRQKYQGIITELKSQNSYRQIPIPIELYNEIKNTKIKNIDGYIFKNISLQNLFKKYNISAHCFRHTYATNLVAKGINLKVASEILGDKFETFINTYVQTSKEEKQKAFKKIIGM